MSIHSDTVLVFYRSKAIAIGSIGIGLAMLVAAALVLTRDQVWGIRFSGDLAVMSTYLMLPLGAVMVLGNLRHALRRGPTVTAGPKGVGIHYTRDGRVDIGWPEIKAFRPFMWQGRLALGITFEDPKWSLHEFEARKSRLVNRGYPRDVHIRIPGRMLDATVGNVARDLEEMRQIHSWRA